ncbi:MAG: 4Fe-4S binding protein [bacterium]
MTEKIGVYVCECGPNIKDAMDLETVVKFAQDLEGVVFAKTFRTLCSEDGKGLITKDIKDNNLTRVVIAACSPKEHEKTFKKVLKEAGLNPFFLQIANIREQCAWVIKEKSRATEKAESMIHAAVQRVVHHEPLETKEMDCRPDVLVVGAGIAGISSALTLAQKNRKVYLLEKLPCIGGKVARFDEVFTNLECASCMLDPKLDEVLHNEHIEVMTLTDIQDVLGSYGNFIVKVKVKARHVDAQQCIGCGACFEACPVNVKNEYNEGLNERKAIYVPYAGALPYVAAIDESHCLRFRGQDCDACQKACPFACINFEEADQIRVLQVGAIILSTGFDLFDPTQAPEFGYGKLEDVYTSLEFERLLSATGPSEGQIRLKNGKAPKRIAFVHCVGSRDERFNEHCSGICCAYSVKFAHLAKKKLPDVSIVQLYSDLCLPGKASQGFFHKFNKDNVIDLRHVQGTDSVKIDKKDGKMSITYKDITGKAGEVDADMVILAPAIQGSRESAYLAGVFDLLQGKGGFFMEEHAKLAPISTTSEGVFIAGCAQGPKDIQGSVAEGQAAAGRILSRLIPGEKLTLEAMTCVVDEAFCSGCKTCIGLCPYKAATYNEEEKHATINEVLCRGCGVCVAACPSGAIQARHFTDQQIFAEIKALLK